MQSWTEKSTMPLKLFWRMAKCSRDARLKRIKPQRSDFGEVYRVRHLQTEVETTRKRAHKLFRRIYRNPIGFTALRKWKRHNVEKTMWKREKFIEFPLIAEFQAGNSLNCFIWATLIIPSDIDRCLRLITDLIWRKLRNFHRGKIDGRKLENTRQCAMTSSKLHVTHNDFQIALEFAVN